MRRALLCMLAVMAFLAACSRSPQSTGSVEHANEEQSEATAPLETANVPVLDNGMVLALENNALALYIHPETAKAAVLDKRNGELWGTNPFGGSGAAQDQAGAQMTVQYYEAGRLGEFSTAAHSVANGQFRLLKMKTGVRVVYTFSNKKVSLDHFPQEIALERFELLLERAASDKERDELKKRFRLDEEAGLYTARKMPDFAVENVIRIIRDAGFTLEEISGKGLNESDEDKDSQPAYLEIPLDYSLEDDQLVVSIDAAAINVPAGLTLNTIKLLPYMGAADREQQGYLFVPDGSGALIDFNSDKAGVASYLMPLYGRDGAIALDEDMDNSQPSRLPVFGIKQENRALFGVIEQGDGIAAILAEGAGTTQNYNIAYSQITLTPRDQKTLTGNNKTNVFPVFPKESYKGTIKQRYFFLYAEEATYSGMAAVYRAFLEEKAGLARQTQGGDIPFYASLIGSVPKRSYFLNIPYTSHVAMTTFDQARTIVNELLDRKVANIKLRYEGWFNGGIAHKLPQSIDVEDNLGGASGLKALAQWLSVRGVELFPDVSFHHVYTDSSAFRATRDASRYISGKPVQRYAYNLATYQRSGAQSYILSPRVMPDVIGKFAAAMQRYTLPGLSLADLGAELHGDYRNSRMIDRQQAEAIVIDQLEELRKKNDNLMFAGGNAYVLPYAKHIVDAPDGGSGFNIIDRQVPFYQMVLHGYADYAGKPFNLAPDQDERLYLLNMLETGANPYVVWSYQPSSLMKDTDFDHLYAIHYRDWLDAAAALYAEANETLRQVSGQLIVEHSELAPGVYRTLYESGISITVNYNDRSVQAGGIAIDARSYVVGGDDR